MPDLVLYRDGQEQARRTVTFETGASWATPTPRATTHVGQSGLTVQSGHAYIDCPNVQIPDGASNFTVVGGRSLPTIARGWQNFWIGGTPDAPMNAGPRTDGKDLCQVKATSSGLKPLNGVFAYIDFHDINRDDGPTGHPDCVQMMAGTGITYGGCTFRRLGDAVQAWFLKMESAAAGGGPIGTVTLDGCRFFDFLAGNAKAVNVAGNSTPGGYPAIRIVNNDFGGRNITVDRLTVDAPGFEFSGNTNGALTVIEP